MENSILLCKTTLQAGQNLCLTAAGFSMWPVITRDMKAEISPLTDDLPEKGSLLLVEGANGLVVHRLWGLTCNNGVIMVLTKGDTNIGFDEPVKVTSVLGKVSRLKDSSGGIRYPDRGFLWLYGKVLCTSKLAARIWAKLCRAILRLNGEHHEKCSDYKECHQNVPPIA